MATGPDDQRHLARPAAAAAAAIAWPWLARGAVGDVAHRVDRLVGRAGGDEDALCRRAGPIRGPLAASEDSRPPPRSPAARPCGPVPVSASAIAPSFGPTTATPSARSVARLRCVAGWSHMRTFMAGAIRTGSVGGEQHGRGEVVRVPARHPGHEVGGGGRDHHQRRRRAPGGYGRCRPRPRDRTGRCDARCPESAAAASGVTNCCAPSVRIAAHRSAALAQAADQVERLVGRDAAADDEQDALGFQT